MLSNRYALGAAAIMLAFAVLPLVAQEEKKAGEKAAAKQSEKKSADKGKSSTKKKGADVEKDPAKKFAQLNGQWEKYQARAGEIRKEFAGADNTKKRELAAEYEGIGTKLRALLPGLRTSGLAAYEAAPNKEETVVKVLLGLMALGNRNQNYEDAIEIGDVLAKGKCDAKGFAAQLGVAQFCTGKYDEAAERLIQAKKDGVSFAELDSCLRELELRESEKKADDLPRVKLTSSKGDIVIELYENEAPETVGNFISLIEDGFYDGLKFHRVIEGFMAQGGCPKGDGSGGPGYEVYCECQKKNHRDHFPGSLSMAHAGRDTGGSQFYITYRRTAHLDGRHTVFGRVVEGMDIVHKLQKTHNQFDQRNEEEADKIAKVEVVRKRGHEYKPRKVGGGKDESTGSDTPKKGDAKKGDAKKGDAKKGDAKKADN